ncbi:unnamed protein product [Pleuronectes platessa]|uniref:Uncharacterized protein n=1 Tax=Pleuronectes platessa TaxID=8262 RepID=A0A9N7UV81_PLEPL|nr:unnamed protein product [Pleuronectes platessa]
MSADVKLQQQLFSSSILVILYHLMLKPGARAEGLPNGGCSRRKEPVMALQRFGPPARPAGGPDTWQRPSTKLERRLRAGGRGGGVSLRCTAAPEAWWRWGPPRPVH